MSFLFWGAGRASVLAEAESAFHAAAREQVSALQAELDRVRFVLEDLRLFLEYAGTTDRESFRGFVTPLLDRNSMLLSLSWHPRIGDPERALFGREVSEAEGTSFQVTERGRTPGSEAMIPAGQRDWYLPVLWLEPRSDFEDAIGFDFRSEDMRRAAIERAISNRAFAVTDPIEILPKVSGEFGLFAVMPSFDSSGSEDYLSGVVVASIRLRDVLDRAASNFEGQQFDVEIWHRSEAGLYQLMSELRTVDPKGASAGLEDDGLLHRKSFTWGGQRWEVRLSPGATYPFSRNALTPLLLLCAGLLLAVFGACYVWTLNSQRRRAESLVDRRTAELARINENLLAEVEQRTAAERELRTHQVSLEARVEDRTADLVAANAELLSEVERRTSAEDALRESSERLSLTLDALEEGVLDWDLEEDSLVMSDHGLVALGYGSPPVTDHGDRLELWVKSLHPEDQERIEKPFKAHLKGESEAYEATVRRRTINGQYRWFLERAKVVSRDDSGRATRMLGTTRDVTAQTLATMEQEEMERGMQEAQKLESLGILSGGIAHDFNNLLAGILGNVELALEEAGSNPRFATSLHDIRLASTRAAELVKQMLAYSGKAPPEIARVDLSALVEEMHALLLAAISKRAEFFVEVGPVFVDGDAAQLRQVVMNLITNASEALEGEPGTITLRTGVAVVDAEELSSARVNGGLDPGEHVFLEVEDSGVGMDETVCARMFEPFFTTKFTGRGLGLAATLGIIRGHSGSLLLESTQGVGTRVRVLLPSSLSEAIEPKEKDSARDVFSPHTLLVVDDEPLVRNLVAAALESVGSKAILAHDGIHGLEILSEGNQNVDLIVLDATMPGMNGAEFLSALRTFSKVPVIVTSGYSEAEVGKQFSGKGVAGFLPKPFRVDELLSMIEGALLERRRPELDVRIDA